MIYTWILRNINVKDFKKGPQIIVRHSFFLFHWYVYILHSICIKIVAIKKKILYLSHNFSATNTQIVPGFKKTTDVALLSGE